MLGSTERTIARGKPAEYQQEIVKLRYRRTIEKVSLANKVVADFGCGNGAQTYQFVKSSCKIIALDIDYDHLHTFSRLLGSQQIESVLLIQCDGFRLPIATGSIDIVLSYEVLEHVADESVALHEIYRILKPGGEMILSVPNKGWIFETHGAYLPLLPWNRVPFFSWLPHSIHRRYAKARIYRKRDITRLLHTHSFKVLSSEYITAPMDVLETPWLRNFFRSTIFSKDTTAVPFLSTSILVHCARV